MRLTIVLTVALLALLAAPALAQPGQTAPGRTSAFASPPPAYVQQYQAETTTTKYGWQVFAADAASWAVLVAASGENQGLITVGSLGMFLGGPIVHLAKGNTRGAGYSLLARTALPLGGALLGIAACDESADDFGCIGSMLLGTTLGYGTALAIDWWYLAEKTEVSGPPSGWASLRPSLQVEPTGARAGVAFQF